MKKYILDTSVLIDNPNACTHFADSEIILPISVINELDKKKLSPGEVGKNARVAIRFLDKISSLGNISQGITIDDNIIIKIDTTYRDLNSPEYRELGNPNTMDSQILACAFGHWYDHDEQAEIILVSNDLNLRVRCRAMGMKAISYEGEKSSYNDLYMGMQTIQNEIAAAELQKNGYIDPSTYSLSLFPNECLLLNDDHGNNLAMGRLVADNKIKLIKKSYPWNLKPRNMEQSFAIDLIMDKNVDLITLVGCSGGGKTLVALSSALELVINDRDYQKLVIYRPIQPVGNDIGYIPGPIEEKLEPWFHAIMDNFEVLFANKTGGDWKRELEMYQKKGRICLEAVTYIRGRSIPNTIILVDEIQNLDPLQVKTILTRAGENSKIILTGDISQIDTPDLDAMNNGLTYVIEKFKHSELAGHITFTHGERSKLATLASEIL